MKKNYACLFVVACIILLQSCNTTPEGKENVAEKPKTDFDLSAARTWIEKDNAKFSEEFMRGDSMAVASHYASDGLLMMSNSEPAKGKDIAATWGQAMRMGAKDLKITTLDLVGNADLLAETGTFEIYGEGNKLLDKGKYVVVWKQEDGTWKIYRDIGNTSMPAPSAK